MGPAPGGRSHVRKCRKSALKVSVHTLSFEYAFGLKYRPDGTQAVDASRESVSSRHAE